MDTKPVVVEKYILCRREVDGSNEVVKAGPKAPSAIGLVDFKIFIEEHGLHPLEVAQLLKVRYQDIQLLVDNVSWIEPHAKDNLLHLLKILCARGRRDICQFLTNQDGNAGTKNIPHKEDDIGKNTKPK
ncbi:MAG: hypothetical protein AAB969_01675 [Patescibacteria group bacterium]